jgi:hypothetical protein
MIFLGAGLLLAGLLAGWIAPHERTWGMHFLAYLPPVAQVVLVILALAAVVWLWRRGRTLPGVAETAWARWTIALAGGVVFLLLAAKTSLLGDGELWLNDLQAGTDPNPAARAPLLLRSYNLVYPALHQSIHLDARLFFILVSVIAGVITLLAWLRLGKLLRVPWPAVLMLGLAWGGIALFFGYVEMYPLLVAAVSWMLVLMISSLRTGRRGTAVGAAGLGVVALALNHLAVVFIPALLAFALHRFFRLRLQRRTVLWGTVAVLGICGAVYFLLGWWRGTEFFLPLLPPGTASATNPNGRAIFSLAQGLDVLNALFLLAGPLVLLVLLKRRAEWNAERGILWLALIFPLAGLIVHNAQLGGARDWDIAACFLVVVPVLGMTLWQELHPQRALALLAGWILLVTVPWIAIQHSEGLTIRRFRDLLALDRGSSPSGWDYLASHYKRQDDLVNWAACFQEAVHVAPNPRHYANLALYYSVNAQWAEAEASAQAAWIEVNRDSSISDWERQVTDPAAFWQLAKDYRLRYRSDHAERAMRVARILQGKRPDG